MSLETRRRAYVKCFKEGASDVCCSFAICNEDRASIACIRGGWLRAILGSMYVHKVLGN